MIICATCRQLQTEALHCAICGSSLQIKLPLRREVETTRLVWSWERKTDLLMRIGTVVLAVGLGIPAGFLSAGFLTLGLVLAALVVSERQYALWRVERSHLILWTVSALLSFELPGWMTVMGLVLFGACSLIIGALLLLGVPTVSRVRRCPKVVAGATPMWWVRRQRRGSPASTAGA